MKKLEKEINEFGFVFWTHIVIILLIYTSPFLFDWKIIFICLVLYNLQNFIFGGCVLSLAQFHSNEERFFQHYCKKLGFNFSKKKFNRIIDFLIAPLIFLFSLIWQILLDKTPLVY